MNLGVVFINPALEDHFHAFGALHVLAVRVVQLHVAVFGHDADETVDHIWRAPALELALPSVLLHVMVVQRVVLGENSHVMSVWGVGDGKFFKIQSRL